MADGTAVANPLTQAYEKNYKDPYKTSSSITPVGKSNGDLFIGLILATTFVVFYTLIINGVIYTRFYKKKPQNKNEIQSDSKLSEAEKTKLIQEFEKNEDSVREGSLFDAASLSSALLFASFFLILAFFVLWRRKFFGFGGWREELRTQTKLGQDVAYAMRGEESIGNVSNLMANYVHPEDEGKRQALSDNLKFNLNKALKEETLGTRRALTRGEVALFNRRDQTDIARRNREARERVDQENAALGENNPLDAPPVIPPRLPRQ